MFLVKFLKCAIPLVLLGSVGCVHTHKPTQAAPPPAAAAQPVNPAIALAVRSEEIRTDCVAGRRLVCGRIVKVVSDGLVVDSGYLDLLRPPLTESWLIPGTATATRDANAIELKQPGTPCYGLVYLTDLPKRPKAKVMDYVVIVGYPAGTYRYRAAAGIEKPIRKFAAGLDTAVKMVLADEQKNGGAKRADSH